MRPLAFAVALLTIWLGLGVAAQDGYSFAGRLSATYQETQEGYFAIDNQTVIVTKPGTALHSYLKTRLGDRVRLVIEPAQGEDSD